MAKRATTNTVTATPRAAKGAKPAGAPAELANVTAPAPAPAVVAAAVAAPVSTAVRNSAIPKVAAAPAAKKEITAEQIARRAYEIWQSGTGGSQEDNWFRAERELRGI